MEVKTISYSPELLSEEGMVEAIFATTGNVDSVNDRIYPGAFKKTIQERGNRIRVLWQHKFDEVPVGVLQSLEETDKFPEDLKRSGVETVLKGAVKFLPTARAQEVYHAIKAGAVREASIGFDIVKNKWYLKDNVRHIQEVILWDLSFVNWGANPETRILQKTVIPFHSYGIDLDSEWTAPSLSDFTEDSSFENLNTSEKKRIANHFAFSVNYPPETFGDLKLPHHTPSKSGVGNAVWNGVRAAMAALMGARGGVKIPEVDREGVYNHLAQHYKEMDKQPPDFKSVENANILVQAAKIVPMHLRKELWDEWISIFDPKLYRILMEVKRWKA